MNNIYFTSDPHYGHTNIVKGISNWSDISGCRDFETLEAHNSTIVDSINSIVKAGDTLYCLGDWAFGGSHNIGTFRDRLNCRTIHLILGNHDHHIENGAQVGLFTSVKYVDQLSLKTDAQTGFMGKTKFFLSHYSHQVWNNSHHGAIHLFGHSHGSIKGIGRSMDVGVDTHDFYPYHLDEILDIMKGIPVHEVDHHNERTT